MKMRSKMTGMTLLTNSEDICLQTNHSCVWFVGRRAFEPVKSFAHRRISNMISAGVDTQFPSKFDSEAF